MTADRSETNPYRYDVDGAYEQIQAMARRQFGVSAVVGIVLLASAMAIVGGTSRNIAPHMAALTPVGGASLQKYAVPSVPKVIVRD